MDYDQKLNLIGLPSNFEMDKIVYTKILID